MNGSKKGCLIEIILKYISSNGNVTDNTLYSYLKTSLPRYPGVYFETDPKTQLWSRKVSEILNELLAYNIIEKKKINGKIVYQVDNNLSV